MIEVKQLTKIYKSRKSGTCVALDHINFTLPDKGFVFVVGKSGSGKTTLLSLLGGLDTITDGEIIENGRHIEKFSLKEQVFYRNTTIGFVFQDFHLIDEITISDNEMIVNYDVYNSIFGTNFTPQNLSEFTPHEVEFTYYFACDENESQPKYTDTLKIVGLNNNSARINIADNVRQRLQRLEMFTFGYYFDSANAEQSEILFNVASANGFVPNSAIAGSITTMNKAVGVFSRFFNIIFAVLCVTLLLLMVQFELKCIKDKMRDIGIMKSLGARDIDLIFIFGFQVLVVGLAMILLYIVGSFVFIDLANKVLVLSLSELAKNAMVLDVSFLAVKWKYILQNCVLACVIMVASFLAPMLRLRHIKPTNVIKAKE